MADFDPSKFLRHLRAKTPTKATPEPPPRPQEDVTDSRLSALESAVQQLQLQLKASQTREQTLIEENEKLKDLLDHAKDTRDQLETSFQAQISSLEAELSQNKDLNRELIKQLDGPVQKPKETQPKLKLEVRRPAFSPAVAPHSSRYAKQPGKLDLTALVELYKVMPDFPRPVLHIDFSDKMAQYL